MPHKAILQASRPTCSNVCSQVHEPLWRQLFSVTRKKIKLPSKPCPMKIQAPGSSFVSARWNSPQKRVIQELTTLHHRVPSSWSLFRNISIVDIVF